MTASFIPLLAVQQRSHSRIYALSALEHVSGADVLSAGQAVRERLRGKPLVALPKREKPMHVVPWPDTPPPVPVAVETVGSVPLDMLAPCSWKFLVKLAALRHRQTMKAILGSGRNKDVVKARHEAMYLVAGHTGYSIARIGNKFGRDHTSVLHALAKFPPMQRERVSPFVYDGPVVRERTPPERAAMIVRGFEEGVPRAEIAEQIGMSLATVKRFAYEHSLTHQSRRKRGGKATNG
ncbi:helix-turn-helix domain-containing protein [Devosia submarina]|uniref:helix-turn-helix domain-containing protein n=1 Tax=Devosia submarina TaxID=1173082 RepID=UPI000D3AB4BF|nr:helix-turn-helix domain-containing protein [Devosia submarina]